MDSKSSEFEADAVVAENDAMDEDEAGDVLVSYQNSGRRRSSILRQLMMTDPSIRAEIAEMKEEHISSLVSVENLYGQELVALNARRRAELLKARAEHAVQHAVMKAQVQHAHGLLRRMSLECEGIRERSEEGEESPTLKASSSTEKTDISSNTIDE